jgi:hypothetical protein
VPLLNAAAGDTVQYRNADGETANVYVTGVQPTAPAAPSVTTQGTGGTLGAATYSYRVTRVVGGAEGPPSTAGSVVVGAGTTNRNNVALPGVAGVQYGVYGRTAGTERFIGLSAAGATTFADTGAVTPDAARPATGVTADGRIGALQFHPKRVLGAPSGTVVVKATSMKDTDVYFKR